MSTSQGPGSSADDVLPAAARPVSPEAIDVGRVEGGAVEFENWRGEFDRPEPAVPAPLPPDRRVGFALVGLGRLTLGQILPAMAQCRKARPVALVSGSPDKAQVIAAQYGIPAHSVYGYHEMERLADDPAIQAVYIVTPNALHRDQVVAAASAGKHVLCEKPMANTSDEAREMVAACAAAGVKLMIAYRCQFEPYNREAIRLVRSGELGRLSLVEATNTQVQGAPEQWRMKSGVAGGGALPDIGLYCLNATRAVLGEEPVEVFARSWSPQGDPRYAEVEETIAFMLRFPSGAIANCAAGYGAHETKDLRLRLERGWIELADAFAYRGQRMMISHRDGDRVSRDEKILGAANQFTLEIDHFAQCILHDKLPRTPGEEGVQDHVIMEAIYRSAREGGPVSLPPAPHLDMFRNPAGDE